MGADLREAALLTEFETSERQIRKALASDIRKILVIGPRFTGKTRLASSYKELMESQGYAVSDAAYEKDGEFDAAGLRGNLEKFRSSDKGILFIQDYFMVRKEGIDTLPIEVQELCNEVRELSQSENVLTVYHHVNYEEARAIAENGLSDLMRTFSISPRLKKQLDRTIKALIDEAGFGDTFIPAIIMFGFEFIKNDSKLMELHARLNPADDQIVSEIRIRLQELESELKARKEKMNLILGVFGIELSSSILVGTDLLNALKGTLTGVIAPAMAGFFSIGIIGLIAIGGALAFNKTRKNKGISDAFTRSMLTWNEMPQIKRKLVSYRLDIQNRLAPMSGYKLIEKVFSDNGDFKREVESQFKRLDEETRLRIENEVNRVLDALEPEISNLKSIVRRHDMEIESIELDISDLRNEINLIRNSACSSLTPAELRKAETVYYPTKEVMNAAEEIQPGHGVVITGLSGTGKTSAAEYIALKCVKAGRAKAICKNSQVSLTYNMITGLRSNVVVLDDIFASTGFSLSHISQFKSLLEVLMEDNIIIITTSSENLRELMWMNPFFYEFMRSHFLEISMDTENMDREFFSSIYQHYLKDMSIQLDSSQLRVAAEIEPQILNELKLPISYDSFFRNYLVPVLDSRINLEQAITDSKSLRLITGKKYLRLEQSDRNFLKLVCLFPNLNNSAFRRCYKTTYGVDLSGEDLNSLRERNSGYLKDTDRLNIIHSECAEGIWDKIVQDETDVGRLLTPIMELFEDFDTTLQSISCVIEIVKRYSRFGSESIVLDFIDRYLKSNNSHRKHLAAYLLAEISFAVTDDNFISDEITWCLNSDIDSKTEGVFLMKTLSRDSRRKDLVFNVFCDFIRNIGVPGLLDDILSVFSMQRLHSKSFLEDFLKDSKCNLTTETADEMVNAVDLQQPLIYLSQGSENLISGLSHWRYFGLDSGIFSVDEMNSGECIRYVERRADNLGRLYLQLDELIDEGKLKVGREYVLSARISTVNISTETKTDRFGAVVGVAYVDDAGWTPRRDAFQCEVGFVSGTTNETEYKSRFFLGAMPPGCSHLILYLVNVVGVGEACFRDMRLMNS